MTFKKLAITAALTATVATSALASDRYAHYGSVEGWNVFTDAEKNTCFIEAKDDAGNVVQMGLTSEDRSVAYIGVFTQAETDIKKGQKEAVAVVLGDNLYVGEATGMRGNITKGYSGGYVLTDDPEIVTQIQKQYEMVVFPEKAYGFIVDLTGTYKAMEMARECNEKQLQ